MACESPCPQQHLCFVFPSWTAAWLDWVCIQTRNFSNWPTKPSFVQAILRPPLPFRYRWMMALGTGRTSSVRMGPASSTICPRSSGPPCSVSEATARPRLRRTPRRRHHLHLLSSLVFPGNYASASSSIPTSSPRGPKSPGADSTEDSRLRPSSACSPAMAEGQIAPLLGTTVASSPSAGHPPARHQPAAFAAFYTAHSRQHRRAGAGRRPRRCSSYAGHSTGMRSSSSSLGTVS